LGIETKSDIIESRGDGMKILVCKNKQCYNPESDELLKALMDYYDDVEFTHASCVGLCGFGPNVMIFPEAKMYGGVTKDRVHDLVHNNIEDLKHPQDRLYSPDMDVYASDPGHRRHVKLFRYQLEKMTDTDWRSIRDALAIFSQKYEIDMDETSKAVKVALLGTTKGPEIPKLVAYMGKEEAFKRIDKYLSDNKYRL